MAKLIVKTGEKAGIEFEVTDGTVMGREAGVPIPIVDVKASRRHAKFVAEGAQFALEDLKSTNGTFVNGSRVTRVKLHHGDVIRVGTTDLLYNDPASRRPEPPPPPPPPGPPPPPPAPPKKVIRLESGRGRRR